MELTYYAVSTENFNRPEQELDVLFEVIKQGFIELCESDIVDEHEVRINIIGDTDRVSEHFQQIIDRLQQKTRQHENFQLNIAIGYGGRDQLLKVTKKAASTVQQENIDPQRISSDWIENNLYDPSISNVDLFIRAGNEQRTSNFLPWRANGARSAAYFCSSLWPDFTQQDLLEAILHYSRELNPDY